MVRPRRLCAHARKGKLIEFAAMSGNETKPIWSRPNRVCNVLQGFRRVLRTKRRRTKPDFRIVRQYRHRQGAVLTAEDGSQHHSLPVSRSSPPVTPRVRG